MEITALDLYSTLPVKLLGTLYTQDCYLQCPADIKKATPALACRVQLLSFMAIVINPDKAHLCPTRGVMDRSKLWNQRPQKRDLQRDPGRQIHHLRTLVKNWARSGYSWAGIPALFLAIVHSPESNGITQIVMIINSSVTCDVWLGK